MTTGEVPLGLSHELKCRDPVQRDNIVGLVWKLVDRLVRDEHTLDRIQIEEARIFGQLCGMHLLEMSF